MDAVQAIKVAVLIAVAIMPITIYFYWLSRPGRREVGYTYNGGGDMFWNSNPSSPDSDSTGGHHCSSSGYSGDGGSCGGGDSGGGGGSN